VERRRPALFSNDYVRTKILKASKTEEGYQKQTYYFETSV
jgi:hypothetical protein